MATDAKKAVATDLIEEQFVLRVEPPDLAEKLRKWLREETGLQGRVELVFAGGAHRQITRCSQRMGRHARLAGRGGAGRGHRVTACPAGWGSTPQPPPHTHAPVMPGAPWRLRPTVHAPPRRAAPRHAGTTRPLPVPPCRQRPPRHPHRGGRGLPRHAAGPARGGGVLQDAG
jgi:hypothetical protein